MSLAALRLPFAALVLAVSAFQSVSTPLRAQEAPDEAFSGRLEAGTSTELKVDLKGYAGELRLKSILAPGSRVKAGDVVATLDATDFDRWLARTRENAQLADQALQAAQDGMDQYNVVIPQQLQKTQRDFDRAAEALDFFRKKEKQNRIRNSEMGLESFQNSIEDQEEELAQLEKLYKGNDLAQESQDIVLNRSRRRLKQSKERFEMSKESHKRFVELDIPRQEQDLVAGVENARNELNRIKRMVDVGNFDVTNKLVRSRQGAEDAKRALADLEADAGAFTIKATHAGLVVVGGLGGNNSVSMGLKAGDKLQRGQAVAGVIDTSKLTVTMQFPAAARDKVVVGASVEAKAADGVVARGRVTAVGFVVDAKGRLSATVEVENTDGKLLVGLKVEIKLS